MKKLNTGILLVLTLAIGMLTSACKQSVAELSENKLHDVNKDSIKALYDAKVTLAEKADDSLVATIEQERKIASANEVARHEAVMAREEAAKQTAKAAAKVREAQTKASNAQAQAQKAQVGSSTATTTTVTTSMPPKS